MDSWRHRETNTGFRKLKRLDFSLNTLPTFIRDDTYRGYLMGFKILQLSFSLFLVIFDATWMFSRYSAEIRSIMLFCPSGRIMNEKRWYRVECCWRCQTLTTWAGWWVLVMSQTTLYFIAQKMGTWSVLQKLLADKQVRRSFLGKGLTFQSNGRTVAFKIQWDRAVSFVQGHGCCRSIVDHNVSRTGCAEGGTNAFKQSSMEIASEPVSVKMDSPEPEDVSVSSRRIALG